MTELMTYTQSELIAEYKKLEAERDHIQSCYNQIKEAYMIEPEKLQSQIHNLEAIIALVMEYDSNLIDSLKRSTEAP